VIGTPSLVRLGQGDFVREIFPHDRIPDGDHMTATTLMNQITKGRRPKPRRVMLYGTHGIGKSTFGAMAETPIFIPTEDGLGDIECESFPLARSLGDVMAALETLSRPSRTSSPATAWHPSGFPASRWMCPTAPSTTGSRTTACTARSRSRRASPASPSASTTDSWSSTAA
jgi:hypothetical protein